MKENNSTKVNGTSSTQESKEPKKNPQQNFTDFIKDATEKMGGVYSDDMPDKILSKFDNDYDKVIDYVADNTNIKDKEAFKPAIYEKYGLSSPNEKDDEDQSLPSLPTPTNLILGEDTPPDQQEQLPITEDEDDTTYLGDIARSLGKGATTVSQGIVRLPATLYRIAALPQNLLSNIPGLEGLEVSKDSNSAVLNFLDDNKLTQYYDEDVKQRGEKLKKYGQSATEQWKKGDKLGALKTVGAQAAESIPLTALLFMSGGTGAATEAGIGIGTFATGQKLHELDESNPDMNEVIKVTNSILTGASEAASESMSMGTIGIGKKLLAKEGVDGLKKIIQKSFMSNMGKKVGSLYNVASPMVGEGLTEAAAQYTENYVDLVTGASDDPDLMRGVFDSFLVGTMAGGVISAPISTYNEVVTQPAARQKVKKDFKKSEIELKDLAHEDYANGVEQIVNNHQDINQSLQNFMDLNEYYDVNTGEQLVARNYLVSAINLYNTNDARKRSIQEKISKNIGKDGKVTMTTIDGQSYSIRNTQDLGKDGKAIFIKDKDGVVKTVISSKITKWESKEPSQIEQEQMDQQDMDDLMLEQEQEIQEQNAAKGLEEGKTVETPHGKKTLVSLNPDNTATVVDQKGEETIVSTDEIEAYKTTEQKDAEKVEAEANQALMEGIAEGATVVSDEPLTDQSETRVITFDNGQGKIITPEGEQVFETEENLNAAMQEFASAEMETAQQDDLDSLPPDQAYEMMVQEDPENIDVANEIFGDKIAEIRSQAEESRKLAKETSSIKEKKDLLVQAKQQEAEAVRLEGVFEAEQINQEYQQEQENAPYNQLMPWEQELIGRTVGLASFINQSDEANVNQQMGQAWLRKDGQPLDTLAKELSEQTGQEVTEQDIVDFIIANPSGNVRNTTDKMKELAAKYKELTGKTIAKHEVAPETKPDVEGEVEVKDEPLGEAPKEVPFRATEEVAEEQVPTGVNITEKAQEDLKQRKNAIKELNKLQAIFGVPIEVINSEELTPEAKDKARRIDKLPKAFYQGGTAYVLSDQITSVSDVKKSYLHESVLHKGLDILFDAGPVTLLGKTYETKNDLLSDAFAKMDNKSIEDRAKIYFPGVPLDQLTEAQQRELAEEALATLNETESPRLQVWMDKLHNFIKKLFGFTNKQFSKADLRNMLREHRELIIKQKQDAKQEEGAAEETSQTERIDSEGREVKFRTEEGENFNQWKGDNRLVEDFEISDVKTGEPIVARAYHGTTHSFYKFEGGEKGNIEGHLGKTNYFTSDKGDAEGNYGAEGADLTGRIERRKEELEYNIEEYVDEDTFNYEGISEEFNIPIEDIQDLDTIDDISHAIASNELKGGEEQVLDLYLKLNNPLVLGRDPVYIDAIDEAEIEDYMDDAAQEIADEYEVDIEEAKEDYSAEVRERAMENSGAEDRIVEAMRLALEGQEVYDKTLHDFLPEYYGGETDLNQIDKDLRASEELMYITNEEGELANAQVISDFYEELGYDGVILTDVHERFPNMGLYDGISHIHIPDQYNNQIKLADGSNVEFGETSDIRFRTVEAQKEIDAMLSRQYGSPYRSMIPNFRGITKDKIRKAIKDQKAASGTGSIVREISKFDSPEEFSENVFFHGTGSGVSGGLKPSITMSESEAERSGGGGYGERYWGVSASKNKNKASNFTGTSNSGTVYPVILRKGANVISMPEIEDAVEIEDIIEDLWGRKVDAVKIGDWTNEYSEEEIVILNPKALYKFNNGEGFRVYGKRKFNNPTEEDFNNIYNKSKELVKELDAVRLSPKDERNAKLREVADQISFESSLDQPKFRVADSQQELDDFVKDSKVKETVYHGTDAVFDEFDTDFIFTTPNDYIAESYATREGSDIVMPLRIKIDNPLIINYDNISDIIKDAGYNDMTVNNATEANLFNLGLGNILEGDFANLVSYAKSNDHDGLKFRDKSTDNYVSGIAYVVFSPDQILIEPKEDVKFRTSPTVYHGSDQVIDKFDMDKARGSGVTSRNKAGIFFTSDPDFAKSWGENLNERKLELKKPLEANSQDPVIKEIFGEKGFTGNIKQITENKADQLKEAGYDGVIGFERWTNWDTSERNKSDVYMMFSEEGINKPTEVKIEEEREKVETDPSEAQQHAGNYKKGHIKFDGFDISIENPKGSIRKGKDDKGNEWSSLMMTDYGYLKRTEGADGDQLDVFMGEDYESNKVFVVDQINTDGKFDEVKLLVNFTDIADAANAYLLAYEEGWDSMGSIMETNKDLLKDWINHGKTSERYETGEAWSKIYPGISSLVANEGQMPKPKQQKLQALRGKGYKSVERMERELQDIYRRYGKETGMYDTGQDKQQRELQEGKLSLDDIRDSIEKQKKREEVRIQREEDVPERMGEGTKRSIASSEIKDTRLQMEHRESPYYTFWLSTQELEDPNVQGRIDADGPSGKKVWDKYIRIQRENQQRLERKRSGRREEEVKFRATSSDPEVQKLLDKLQAVQQLSKTAAKVKGLEDEAKKARIDEQQAIYAKLDAIKEGAKLGKEDTKEMITEVQKAITDYAKKNIPLGEAGTREIGSVLTLIKDSQTPASLEKAFTKVDELAGTTEDKTERRKYVSKVNRLLKWMTGLKKSGTKKVGKFNYEDTKQFQELKEVNDKAIALNKKSNSWKSTAEEKMEAENVLNQMWEDLNAKEGKTALDDAMMKLIELRRLGSQATPRLAQIVSDELEAIYSVAKEAKSEADMEKAVQRKDDKEMIKNFLRSDSNVKDLPWFKKAMKDLNTKTADWMGNWETLLTMLGGYELRDKYSLLLHEADMATGKQETTNNVMDEAKSIYNTDSKRKTLDKVHELSKNEYSLRQPNRKGEEGEGTPMELSKLHLMDIYNAIKNEDVQRDYYMAYGDIIMAEDGSRDTDAQMADGKKRIDALVDNLSDQDKAFADAMQKELDKYYDRLNEIHIKLYNRDLPRVENYWPSTAEREQDIDVMQQFLLDSRHPSATKERSAHRTPEPRDAFNKFTKHIEEAEWYSNMSLPINDINKAFADKNVQSLITDARGEKFNTQLSDAIKNVGLVPPSKGVPKSELEKGFNALLGNWVTSKIGATPTVPIKQLLSAVNYSENMPTTEWATGFIKTLASPKDSWQEMMRIPYLKARLGDGYSEAVQRALNGDENVHKSKATNAHQAFKNLMTIGTRYGDITAIIFGGKPYLDYLIKKEGLSEKDAVDKFLQDTLRSQQSPFSSSLSKFQNSKNVFARSVFAFANTPSQYMRKLFEANQNLRVQQKMFADGKIDKKELNKAWKQARKAHQIYGLINSIVFTSVGAIMNGIMKGSDWDDELWKDILVQIEQSYIGGLPVFKDLIGGATKASLGMKVYDDSKPILEGLDQVADAGIKLAKGDVKDPAKEYEKIAQGFATTLGVPYYNIKKTLKSFDPDTYSETRVREAEDKLNKLQKSDSAPQADAATDLKKSYSKAKAKATKLKKEGEFIKADRITNLIDRSKVHIWDTDYSTGDMKMEKEMFDNLIESID